MTVEVDVKPNYKKVLQRTYAAAPEKVFAAWTRPELLSKWFMPNERWQDAMADIDLRVGGKFKITMRHSDGDKFVAVGVYETIQPPSKLAFTWSWEANSVEAHLTTDTLVTVDLVGVSGGTEVTLTHERFLTTEDADQHGMGWTGMLETLDRFVTTE